jgi:hypothetical protein
MDAKKIILAVVVILLLYIVYKLLTGNSSQISGMQSAKDSAVVSPDDLPDNNNTNNYTYSVWFYVDDWSYRYGEPKIILGRLDGSREPSPSIVLGAIENNIKVSVACYPNNNSDSSQIHTCGISNVPIQRWVNLIISLYGRTLDVYLDGKLVRTCVLPGIAKVNDTASIYITPEGGFSGYTSNIQYWADATNPQEAYDIYRKGYGNSIFGGLFDKYQIKISFLEDNVEQGSIEI